MPSVTWIVAFVLDKGNFYFWFHIIPAYWLLIFHVNYSKTFIKMKLYLQQNRWIMREFIELLKNSVLFEGTEEHEIISMLKCLQGKEKKYDKGEYVLRAGEMSASVSILLKGRLLIQNDDYWGNRSIVNSIGPGEIFGEAYAVPSSKTVLNDVVAQEQSLIMTFDLSKILTTCPAACQFHSRIIKNLFFAVSKRNQLLVEKLWHISRRTTREKLISYLSQEAARNGSSSFTIPFNRQQLADFLSVDRSAMSAELGKMRDQGLIEFERNRFTLLNK